MCEISAVTRESALRALRRNHDAGRIYLRLKLLGHPSRLGYPTQSRLQKWKQRGISVPVKVRTPWGQRMTVTLPDDVSVALHRRGYFEYDLTAFYLSHLRNGMTFVDVGAHVGYFSMLASNAVGPTGKVIAFEPTPSTFKALTQNTYSQKNITAVHSAAWSEASSITIRDFGVGFRAYNSVFEPRLPKAVRASIGEETHSVPAVPLDDYVSEHRCNPDVVKIDVESAEMQVLLGMQKVLSGPRPVLSLEVGDIDVPGVPCSRELVEKVLSFDYCSYELHDGRPVPHKPRDEYGYENLVFIPAERAREFA
ncbi:FkbM family methyltransferase [Streptomyces sp. NPDC051104]|uniref:FkbM family methyltransferase n=1 Tax=Streptomyces sp. NPDC051104 TaxID=3155044 RepID=UPI00341C20C1